MILREEFLSALKIVNDYKKQLKNKKRVLELKPKSLFHEKENPKFLAMGFNLRCKLPY